MLFKTIALTLIPCLLWVPQTAAMEDVTPFLSLGYDTGGDTLVKIEDNNGSTTTLNAHSGLRLGGGAVFALPSDFELEAGIFYKLDTTESSDGEISFSSLPIEVLFANRLTENHRIGAGLVYALNNELECDIDGRCSGTEEFKDATGLLLQYDYTFNRSESKPGWRVGFRYTIIELASKIVDDEADGDSAGFLISLLF